MKIVKFKENRWKIIDENGKTLDDAQGYGFTSEKAAKKCWNFKQNNGNKKSAKKFKNSIHEWWHDNSDLYSYIEDELWISFKDNVPLKFNEIVDLVRAYMKEHQIDKPDTLHTWQLVKYMP